MTVEHSDIAKLSGPERERFLRKTRRQYFIYTWLSRLYMTLVMSMFAALGAESWFAAGIMILLGGAMDIIRNFVAPDLTLDIRQVAADVAAAQTPDPPFPSRKARTDVYVIPCVLAVYMLGLIIAEYGVGSDGLHGYLTLFSPLHELASSAMSAIRRHVAQLQGAGLTDRALFVTHLYAIFGIYVVSSAFLISLLIHKFFLSWNKMNSLKGIHKFIGIKELNKSFITLFVFVFIIDAVFSHLVRIKFGENYLAWRIDISNAPFFMLLILGWFNSMFLAGVCGCLIKLRAATWEILNSSSVPSPRNSSRVFRGHNT